MEGKIKNNEQYKDFLEWLTKYIKEIKEVMLLNAWSITFSVTPIKTNSEKRIFTIVRDAQYITANILWYKLTYNIWKNKEIETLKQAVIHELTHVVLTELSDCAYKRFTDEKAIEDAEERAAEMLSKTIYNLMKKGGVNNAKTETNTI